jgi:hypothetical protein
VDIVAAARVGDVFACDTSLASRFLGLFLRDIGDVVLLAKWGKGNMNLYNVYFVSNSDMLPDRVEFRFCSKIFEKLGRFLIPFLTEFLQNRQTCSCR